MQYKYGANLEWSKGVSTSHKISLDIGLSLSEFLKAKNVAVELAINQANIRRDLKRVVVEEILPNIFLDIGASPAEGKLDTNSHSKTKGSAHTREIRSPQDIDVQISDQIKIEMNITTDREVTALEALAGSDLSLADAITNDIMMHLHHQYLGVTNHSINSISARADGQLTNEIARHKGDPAN